MTRDTRPRSVEELSATVEVLEAQRDALLEQVGELELPADAARAYVAARDATEAADGSALMDAVWRQDEAWHALRVAVGAPCESSDCGCGRVGVFEKGK